jgi:hypothetical protein
VLRSGNNNDCNSHNLRVSYHAPGTVPCQSHEFYSQNVGRQWCGGLEPDSHIIVTPEFHKAKGGHDVPSVQ